MKEEALKLADEFDWHKTTYEVHKWCLESQSMIRRLVEELDKQGEPVAWMHKAGESHYLSWTKEPNMDKSIPLYTTPQTKPLSDEEMEDIESRVYAKTISKGKPMGVYAKTLCRAIEERILGK